MRKLLAAIIIFLPFLGSAQSSIVQEGEFGIGIGAGHYFGDQSLLLRFSFVKTLEIILPCE
jgi:regulator of protease activity HflC (stomatin/prohibitin superfamily)